jgi:hypothetical protein
MRPVVALLARQSSEASMAVDICSHGLSGQQIVLLVVVARELSDKRLSSARRSHKPFAADLILIEEVFRNSQLILHQMKCRDIDQMGE